MFGFAFSSWIEFIVRRLFYFVYFEYSGQQTLSLSFHPNTWADNLQNQAAGLNEKSSKRLCHKCIIFTIFKCLNEFFIVLKVLSLTFLSGVQWFSLRNNKIVAPSILLSCRFETYHFSINSIKLQSIYETAGSFK